MPTQSVKSCWGEFKAVQYEPIEQHGVKIRVEFHPDPEKVDATKIGLVQTVDMDLEGRDFSMNPTRAEQRVPNGVGEGRRIDQFAPYANPIYYTGKANAGEGLGDTRTLAKDGQHGYNHVDESGARQTKEAFLSDGPTMPHAGNNSHQFFETAALAIEGNQAGQYMGSVEWGWEKDGAGNFSMKPFALKTDAAPTEEFFAAAEQWNDSKAAGTYKVSANPATIYRDQGGGQFVDSGQTLAQDTELILYTESAFTAGPGYNRFMIKNSPSRRRVFLRTEDVKDQGDGMDTIDLPISTPGEDLTKENS